MSKKAVRGRSRELDQFYTDPKYAASFLEIVSEQLEVGSVNILLEPSAGTGSFYNLLDPVKRIGLDLEPKSQGILQQDFFTWMPLDPKSKIITIGNPPFGKNSNLAVKFFNHAAKFSQAIAFILPRTFKKASIINRLDKRFHLVYEEIVPENSFIFNGKPYDVWCCAQIWVKREVERPKIKILNFKATEQWFEIVDPEAADFTIQRVGGRAGLIRTEEFKDYSTESHWFIKQKDPVVLKIFQKLNFESIKYNTAGNPSISPSELIELWIEQAKEFGISIDDKQQSSESHILNKLISN